MNKQQIFHVITTIERGGAECAVATLAKAQARKGHEVTVIPLKGIPELENDLLQNNVKVSLCTLNKPPIFQIRALKRAINRGAIIHAHLPRSELICRIAFGRGRTILTRHNSESFFPSAPKILSQVLSKWVTKKSELIAISNAVLDYLESNLELHRSCVPTVIYYGYQKQSTLKREFKLFNWKLQRIRIGTVSRLTNQKNLPLLITLTKLLQDSGYDVETTIIGRGPLDTKLKKFTQELDLENRVHFLGRKSDVIRHLETLNFFILTSIYEGFGLALLEAMDAQVPIIAPNNSAIPEVLGYSHPGLFHSNSIESLFETTHKMIDDGELQRTTLELQKLRLDYFSVSRYLEGHEVIYTKFKSLQTFN